MTTAAQPKPMTAHDEDFPLPWTPSEHAPWLLIAANGRQVATFQAWNDRFGALGVSEKHCAHVSRLINANGSMPKAEVHDVSYNANDLRNIQRLVVTWADGVFPQRKPSSALLKLFEEIGELIRNPTEAAEYADILIMLVDLAHMHGIHDLGEAVRQKMKINSGRQWRQTDMGVMQHD